MSGTSTDQTQNDSGTFYEGSEQDDQFQDQTATTESQGGQPSGDDIVPVSGAVAFKNPKLAEMTPEQIEQLIETQQAAIRSQNQELNAMHERLTTNASAPAPKAEELPEYEESFITPQIKTLESRLERRITQMVEPLLKDQATRRVKSVRENLAGSLRYFAVLEPYIDQIIRNNGGNPQAADEATLQFVYNAAVGAAVENGIDLNGLVTQSSAPAPTPQPAPTPEPTRNAEPPMSIPQRRPSSAPVPETNQGKKRRALTENERTLARTYGMTDEQYLDEMDKDLDSVVTPGFSKDNW